MDMSFKLTKRVRPDYAVIVDPNSSEARDILGKEFARIQEQIAEIQPEKIACLMAIFVEKNDNPENEREHKVRMFHMGDLADSIRMLQTLAANMRSQLEQTKEALETANPPKQDKDLSQ